MLAAERRRDGVPVPREVLDELRETGRRLGIALPPSMN